MKTLWDIAGATLIGAVIVAGSAYAAPIFGQPSSASALESEPLMTASLIQSKAGRPFAGVLKE